MNRRIEKQPSVQDGLSSDHAYTRRQAIDCRPLDYDPITFDTRPIKAYGGLLSGQKWRAPLWPQSSIALTPPPDN